MVRCPLVGVGRSCWRAAAGSGALASAEKGHGADAQAVPPTASPQSGSAVGTGKRLLGKPSTPVGATRRWRTSRWLSRGLVAWRVAG